MLNWLKYVHDLLHQFQGNHQIKRFEFDENLSFSYSPRRSMSPIRSSSFSLTSTGNSVQLIREDSLIQCYNDLNSRERLTAMDTLRTISDNYDMNRRICFNVIQVNQSFVLLIGLNYFRKHFPLVNVVVMNGNSVFVHNLRLHIQVLIHLKMLFKIILIEMLNLLNYLKLSR